jgi:glycosyltransferase involved in cell wall biosynthesis
MNTKICLHTTHQISQNYIGGTERFLIKLAKELQVLGWTPFILCSNTVPNYFVEGIKVIGRIPKPYRRNISKYKQLNYEFLRNEVLEKESTPYDIATKLSAYVAMQLEGIDADIFHLNSFVSASCFNGKINNYVVTNHENDIEMDYFWGDGFFQQYAQLVSERKLHLDHAAGLYAPSKFYSEFYTKRFNLAVNAIKLGVHISDFHTIIEQNRSIQDVPLDKNTFVALLPSRLNITQKGHDTAITACKILKEKKVNLKLIISGIGKSTEEDIKYLRKMIKNNDVEDIVVLSSYGDIMNAYASCDAVISPERYCSYGLSISESLALGINTVLSDIPTYKEIASGYNHAYFFKKDSPEDLAEKLLMLHQKSERVGHLETIRFRADNDMRDCAKSYSQVYRELLMRISAGALSF